MQKYILEPLKKESYQPEGGTIQEMPTSGKKEEENINKSLAATNHRR